MKKNEDIQQSSERSGSWYLERIDDLWVKYQTVKSLQKKLDILFESYMTFCIYLVSILDRDTYAAITKKDPAVECENTDQC